MVVPHTIIRNNFECFINLYMKYIKIPVYLFFRSEHKQIFKNLEQINIEFLNLKTSRLHQILKLAKTKQLQNKKKSKMCQCLICECWWCSCCDIACLGVGSNYCCFGCWCCKHDQITAFNQNCCNCCEASGFGGAMCCLGSICCAPEWLKNYSNKKKSRTKYED